MNGQTMPPDLDDEAGLITRLAAYMTAQIGRDVTIERVRRFASGFSWTTIGFAIAAPGIAGVTALILRLGPAKGLFAPYSAQPQFFALQALAGSDVPAPRAFFWSDDSAILGAPFFISEWVQGEAPLPWTQAGGMTDQLRDALGMQFADAIGALHNIEWHESGLAAMAAEIDVHNAAARQIAEWEANYRRWRLRAHPMIHYATAWLRANVPVAPRVSIVHGDYRLGNFLAVGEKITAILDWELVHLGDPHEDLAWACLPQYRAGTTLMSRLIAREALYARYEARTGIAVNVAAMRFYEIFSLYKLAITHMAGVAVFERNDFHDMRMPAMGTQIAPVLRQMEKALEAA